MAVDLPRKNCATCSFVMAPAALFGLTTTTTSAMAGTVIDSASKAATFTINGFMRRSLENEIDGGGSHRDGAMETRLGLHEQARTILRLDAVDLHFQRGRTVEVPAHANAVRRLLQLVTHISEGVDAGRQGAQGRRAGGWIAWRAGGRHGVVHAAIGLQAGVAVVRQKGADTVAAHHVPRGAVADIAVRLALRIFG